MRSVFAIVLLLFSTSAGLAQVFPDHTSTTVNDFADMIDPETEAQIVSQLEALERDTGVELAVVTLSSVAFYANDMAIPDYATALFNTWGIGKAETNDGMLLLVFRDDRELRIELGEAYGQDWNRAALQVVNQDILPKFRAGDFSQGISTGVTGMITRISDPFRAGEAAPTNTDDVQTERSDGGGIGLGWILGVPAALIALIVGAVKAVRANEKCPVCGAKGLKREKHVLQAATRTSQGSGETIKTCPKCGHRQVIPYTIAKLSDSTKSSSSSSGGSFGGGRSGGGGASGKW